LLKCKKHFGTTPEHIIYLINELEERISQIESIIEERHPVMVAAMIKIESMSRVLQNNDVLTESEIDKGVKNIMKEIE